ncbi:MAG: hypothetical protein OSB14_05445 [Planctomycetota bacterium]|nr:hypothetical protein [Planctomycetota bacterium]
MKQSLLLLFLCPLSTACHAPDGSDRLADFDLLGVLGAIGDMHAFANSAKDFISDEDDSPSDDTGFITPAHPTD